MMQSISPSDLYNHDSEKQSHIAPTVSLTRCQRIKAWIKKYCSEGQHLDESAADRLANLPKNPTLEDLILIKYRKYTAMIIPFLLMQTVWWLTAIRHDFFPWYKDYWHMPLTMCLGSLIGGMTSEGSGAVAFPVMTLALHIAPSVARDFCIMIQSCGMICALCCVLFMKVKIESRAVILGTVGAIPGFIIGVHYIDPMFTGPEKKMLFVAIWTAFAIALAILNSQKKRHTFKEIPDFCLWKGIVLIVTGFVGGVFDAFAGSGIDIAIFCIVTLLFRVTEKTATPTTVVLKGLNAVFGFYWRAVIMGDISEMAWKYYACSIPISSFVAPVGSLIGSHLHRQLIASFVYILEVAALIGFLFTKPSWQLISVGAAIIFGGLVFFSSISKAGYVIMTNIEKKAEEDKQKNGEKP